MILSRISGWLARGPILVGIASASLMIIELVFARMLAPYLGVSVFTWTAVIGSVLVGMSVGSYAGGVIADRTSHRLALAKMFALTGVATLVLNYTVPILGNAMGSWNVPLTMKVIVFSLYAMLPMSFLLSCVQPVAMKMDLETLAQTGRRWGSLGAANAIGSLIGTLLAGVVLIGVFGTKPVLSVISALLFAIGFCLVAPSWLWPKRYAALAAVLLVGDLFVPRLCQMETQYFCIRVEAQADGAYVLKLDHLVHSYVRPEEPSKLGYKYEQVYANLVASRHGAGETFSNLFIGGGGYAMPRYLDRFYPSSTNVVIEIDPGVTEANHALLQLPRDTKIQTVNMDARAYLRQDTEHRFSFAFGDAFNDFSVPYHLTTVEFHERVKAHLTPDGVYAMNIIDDARYGQFLAAMVRTLRSVWTHVYVSSLSDEIRGGRNTYVLLATDVPIDRDAWGRVTFPDGAAPEDGEDHAHAIQLLSDEQVETFLAGHDSPALTDNFVPTDRYLAPIFMDAY